MQQIQIQKEPIQVYNYASKAYRSSLHDKFPVYHSASYSPDDWNQFNHMKDITKAFLSNNYNIKGHPSNWDTLTPVELMIIISTLQHSCSFLVTKTGFDTSVDIRSFTQSVISYTPPYIIIAPSKEPGARLGAFCCQNDQIKKDMNIGTYSGTKFLTEEKMKEETEIKDNDYIFTIRKDSKKKEFVIAFDGKPLWPEGQKIKQGSWSRFVNHPSSKKQKPNCEYRNYFPKRDKYPKLREFRLNHRVDLFALRDISMGEELLAIYDTTV